MIGKENLSKKNLPKAVAVQRKIFGSGRVKALLKDECLLDGVTFYELANVSDTRWVAPRVKSYMNSLNTFAQQSELLLYEKKKFLLDHSKTTAKKREKYKELAHQISNRVNLALHMFSIRVLQTLKKFSLRRQDRDRAGYLLWPDALEVYEELKQLRLDLKSESTGTANLKAIFANCPALLGHLEIFYGETETGETGWFKQEKTSGKGCHGYAKLNDCDPEWTSKKTFSWLELEGEEASTNEPHPDTKDFGLLTPNENESI